MAGDWLKVEKNTPSKPEILRIACELGIEPDLAFATCFRFWCWCDDNLENGNAVGVTDVMLDALLKRHGFATALVNVGWLRVRNGSLEVPNYDRHLSENAKKRGLSQQRTAKSRSRKCNGESVTNVLPEKRREEIEKSKPKKFVAPTLQEVIDYCKANAITIDAEKFYYYHEAKGWLMGNRKMKDWRKAVKYWHRNESVSESPKPKLLTRRSVNAPGA